jgi:aspartyl-tRNA(Asn)/glutamyl-tRNA(Gln) amidotransferase subunit C
MKVEEKDVVQVAALANLELTAEERTRMVKDLNSILGYIDTLNELNTDDVPPMAQVAERVAGEQKSGSARYAHAMREDEVRPSLGTEVAVSNAPETNGKFFKVPKVIER